ncbi:MAG: DUF4199 domain-containing protein [Muribaculaceae bacterium]|nr:DUF4199 domain-containing protein [Muribaculaceae bacterium]
MLPEHKEIQSPYARGGEDGVVFGVYLSVLVFSMIFSMKMPLLNLVFIALVIFAPVLIFIMQRRYYVAEGGFVTKSALWMQGLVMSACGALIAFALSFVYMRWINPDYLNETFEMSLQTMRESGVKELVDYGNEIEKATGGVNPTSAITFNMTMIWFVTLIGSITALILSFFVSLIPVNKK